MPVLPQRIQRWLRGLAAGLLLALQLLPAGADALPQAQRGVLELPSVPAQGVRLEGEWTLVRDVFLDPAADALPGTFVAVPGPWNAAGGALGWGTYALQVRCPVGQKLALSVPVQRSAMRLYVNGTLVVQQGEPGPSAEAARAAMGARATVTESFACPLAVRAHLSNFNHRQGGMVRAIAAGERMQLGLDIRRQLTYNTLMLGGYAMLGLLSLFFFAARRKDATPLYFGLFCLVQATSSDMVGERNLVLSFGREVPWELALRIEYLAWYATMASFLMVVHRLFLGDVRWRVVRVFLALIGLAMLAVAVLPGRISSHLIVPGQVLTVAMGVYLTRAVAAAARRRDPDAIVMLAGLVFLLVVVVVDALSGGRAAGRVHSTPRSGVPWSSVCAATCWCAPPRPVSSTGTPRRTGAATRSACARCWAIRRSCRVATGPCSMPSSIPTTASRWCGSSSKARPGTAWPAASCAIRPASTGWCAPMAPWCGCWPRRSA